MGKLAQFETWAGKGASIVHWGQAWKNGGVYQPFYPNDFERVRTHGSIPMLDWSSQNLGSGINQPDFQLAKIAAGMHDSHIRNWATGAKSWGKPLFLRFDWEMNSNWFPWGEMANGNQPGDYVRAWQHVHDIFTSVGATNVKWVWSPNIMYDGSVPIASVYPGDAYVDWVAIDGYNWAGDRSSPWLSFAQVFKPTYDALGSLAPTKPLMIAETGTSEDGGPLGKPDSKAAWIRDTLITQLPVNFPRVKALVWFNWNDNNAALDWPIETSQASIDAFAQGIGSSYYTANGFATASTIPGTP